MFILSTDRLLLRRWSLADADHAFRTIYSDPEVMRFIGYRVPHQTVEETRQRIERMLDHYEQHDYGLWAAIEKATGLVLGSCGLKHIEDGPEIEVGYHFARPAWSRGYATESADACLRRLGDAETGTHSRPGRSGEPCLAARTRKDRHGL